MAMRIIPLFVYLMAVLVPAIAAAQFTAQIETGFVFSGYNDVRIPNNGGTKFSLSEDLEIDTESFVRFFLEYRINRKHTVGLLIAPLSLTARGEIDKDITFEGRTFPMNTPLEGTYRFDSYRITYSYLVWDRPSFQGSLGITAKIRDASVAVESDVQKAEKLNTGFVPLLHFSFQRSLSEKWNLILEGDALASPGGQGRAEDVFLGLTYRHNKIGLRAGYRLLEGGADVDEVYNFALVHYAVIGVSVSF